MPQEKTAIQRRQTNDIAPLSEETIAKLLDVQRKELEVKAMELEQRKLEDQHSFEFAQKTLEAQREDRHEDRIKFGERLKVRYVFIVVVLGIVLAFFGYALHLGQGELVGNVLEKVVYYIVGALSSYGYVKYKDSQNNK